MGAKKKQFKMSENDFNILKEALKNLTVRKVAKLTGWSRTLVNKVSNCDTYEDYQDYLNYRKIKAKESKEQASLKFSNLQKHSEVADVLEKVNKDNTDLVKIVNLLEKISNNIAVLADKVDGRKDRRWF